MPIAFGAGQAAMSYAWWCQGIRRTASKKRELALHAMSEVGLSKLEQPDFTASTRAGSPALLVISDQSIPPVYWLPQPLKLDRQGVLTELKRGATIPGAELSNPKPVLVVRTK